jgi:hypothetical protein
MALEEAIKAWQAHNPFKRASPELIRLIEQYHNQRAHAQEALV